MIQERLRASPRGAPINSARRARVSDGEERAGRRRLRRETRGEVRTEELMKNAEQSGVAASVQMADGRRPTRLRVSDRPINGLTRDRLAERYTLEHETRVGYMTNGATGRRLEARKEERPRPQARSRSNMLSGAIEIVSSTP